MPESSIQAVNSEILLNLYESAQQLHEAAQQAQRLCRALSGLEVSKDRLAAIELAGSLTTEARDARERWYQAQAAAAYLPTPPNDDADLSVVKYAADVRPGDRVDDHGRWRTAWDISTAQENDGTWVLITWWDYDADDLGWYPLDESDTGWFQPDTTLAVIPHQRP